MATFNSSRFQKSEPRPLKLSAQSLVTEELLAPSRPLPQVFRATAPDVNLAAWARDRVAQLQARLDTHGGLLLRGFKVDTIADFQEFAAAISRELSQYGERSSPRTQLAEGVYTSTDHPAHQPIRLHNEQSYTLRWPTRIMFCCLQPALEGGATPIASNRAILRRLPPELADTFRRKHVMYVRNYGQGLGLTWEVAFQTRSRHEVEAHCRAAGIDFEWRSDNRLRTRQVRAAFRRHPTTGEELWFNHALFFNVRSLEPGVRDSMLSLFAEDELPTNTFYGDGSPISPAEIDTLHQAYEAESLRFPWQRGDVLVLDNMQVCHGREPFSGPRQVLTAMADLHDVSGEPAPQPPPGGTHE